MTEAQATPERACRKIGCAATEGGSCMEGHMPAEACPFVADPDVDHDLDDDVPEASAGTEPLAGNTIAVHGGSGLNETGLRDFLRWRPAKRIAVLGDLSSGKTTLLCALYDRYLRGPFAGLSFSGSRTLVAMEQLMHYSREASGRATADTKRTSLLDGLVYYHLALAPTGNAAHRQDILLSDRAGEVYQRVRDNPSLANTLSEIAGADRIVLLLDGAKVAQMESWANATSGVRLLLRALLDAKVLESCSHVQVVTTKMDIIDSSVDRASILARLDRFKSALSRDLAPRLGSLKYWDLAARPLDLGSQPAGLDSLLLDWMESVPSSKEFDVKSLAIESEFDRLLLRTKI